MTPRPMNPMFIVHIHRPQSLGDTELLQEALAPLCLRGLDREIYAGAAPCVLKWTEYNDWLAAMKRRLRFGPPNAHVRAHLGQADAADEHAVRIPDRDAVVADGASGVARAPDVAVDVAACAIGTALDAVDHEVAEEPPVRDARLFATSNENISRVPAGTCVAGSAAGADDVQPLVVGREHEAVRIRQLILADHEIDLAAGIDAIDTRRQLAPEGAELRWQPEPWDSTGRLRSSDRPQRPAAPRTGRRRTADP